MSDKIDFEYLLNQAGKYEAELRDHAIGYYRDAGCHIARLCSALRQQQAEIEALRAKGSDTFAITLDADDDGNVTWTQTTRDERIAELEAEVEELRAKLDNAEWCADVVSEANQQRGITDKVREYLDAVSGGDPWGDDEQNLFWAAQDADLREEALWAEIEKLRAQVERQRKTAGSK